MTDSSPAFRYRAFLSYCHADERWARWLHRKLERYSPPASLVKQVPSTRGRPDRIKPVFRDREELSSAASLSLEVNIALADSECLIVICSPNAVRSHWVNEEILAFKRLGRTDRIFCLIVDGEPNSGGETECFPETLRFELTDQGVLGTEPVEPLAADARPHADGRSIALLKLIAGILNVGFDALRQRDIQRRHRTMLMVTGGSLSVTLITLTLAVMAYLSNAEAERRRAQAEDLIGFMLGDLRSSLGEIGRLDVLMSVGNKAMDYFSSLANEDVDDTVLSQRARALRQIGNARLSQGESKPALEAFRESQAIAARLADREPENPDWQISLANSQFYIGLVHWQRGELEAAKLEFEKILPIVDGVVAREPNNAEWLAEQSYAYTNYGRVLELQGQLEPALKVYTEIAEINDQILQLEPDNIDYQLEVGFAHNNIGKLIQSMGRLEEAEAHFTRDLEIKIEVSDSKPNNQIWRDYLATSYLFKGRIQLARGNLSGSQDAYEKAIGIISDLLELDPDQTGRSLLLANSQRELSALQRRLGKIESAKSKIQSSNKIFEALLALDENQSLWQTGMGLNQIEMARLGIVKNDPIMSIESSVNANKLFLELLDLDPSNRVTWKSLLLAELTRGDVYAATGNEALAASVWNIAIERLNQEFKNSQDPELIEIYAALLSRLGRHEEAAPLMEKLAAMGFSTQYL